MSKQSTPVSFSYNLSVIDKVDLKLLRDEWILPPTITRFLAHHYLLYWNKQFLVDNDGLANNKVLVHQGHKYITILDAELSAFAACSRVALSFRHPFGTKFGYVLIKPAIKRYGNNNEH